MPKIKGSGYNTLRYLLKSKDEDFKERYYSKLSSEELKCMKMGISVGWYNLALDEHSSALAILAKMLYPNDPKYLQRMGQEMAKHTMPSFYKVFIRIPSIEFVMTKTAAIWNSFYDTGEACVENFQKDQYTFVLKNFPDYPAFMREYMCGWLKGMCELLNMKNIIVKKIETDPNAWKWEVRYVK